MHTFDLDQIQNPPKHVYPSVYLFVKHPLGRKKKTLEILEGRWY